MANEATLAGATHDANAHHLDKVTFATLLVTLGIVYGDIGTSPLYALKAIVGPRDISQLLVYGGVSAIFWTLTFQTTLKYILITLRADNNGEGGIFSLYTLVRRQKKWLLYPAMIGGGFLLADGIITPPISVSSAIEGLRYFDPHIPTIPIVIGILTLLFTAQQFGTNRVGIFFGPIMMVWFTMLATFGLISIAQHPGILAALNPVWAIRLLTEYPEGFWLLGAVFLCTTGAEALYSDLGHVGRKNIRVGWTFVKLALLLNYFGQAAYLMEHIGDKQPKLGPFYAIVPADWLVAPAIVVATLAAITASQALISGSFTLVNEAIRLELWPRLRVKYPTVLKGQLYIPGINWFLYLGCVFVVLYFQESEHMEAAYGLAVTISMITTTALLTFYLFRLRWPKPLIYSLLTLFVTIEVSFLIANGSKFMDGAWVSLLIGLTIIGMMWVWQQGRKLKNRYVEVVPLKKYEAVLSELSQDKSVPKFATHLVYLSFNRDPETVDRRILYSILNRQPKRADVYWLLNVDVTDEPYRRSYRVKKLGENIFWIQFKLGFRVEPRVNLLFRKVIERMVRDKEVDITSRYESLGRHGISGDFHFVVMQSFLSYENDLPWLEQIIMSLYFQLTRISLTDGRGFGLDTSSVTVEKVPLIIAPAKDLVLIREEEEV